MKKIALLLALFTLLTSQSVYAHVGNEKTLYDDIEFSKGKEQIMYLRGIDAIPYESGAKLFNPQAKLTKKDVAFWAATFKGLGDADAKKEDLQKAAVENGLISSLEGNATYADVNQAYFWGKAEVEKPESELSREEFALFMGQYFKEKVDGKTLFDMAGVEPGPAGVVEKVIKEETGEGETKTEVYTMTIAGQTYKVSGHPKMLYGPVDLTQWEGKKVADSWLEGHEGETVLQIVKLEQGQFTDDQAANSDQANDNSGKKQSQVEQASQTSDFPVVPVILVVVLIMIVGWLFMKKKK